MLLYLAQEGRGIGLLNKLQRLQAAGGGLDTVDANLKLGLPADLRDYGIGAQILVDLGLTPIRILTNNPKKIRGLEGYGLSVTDQIPIEHAPNPHNEAYLRTKAERMGHTLHHQGLPLDEEMLHAEQRARTAEREGATTRMSAATRSSSARFYEDLAERLVDGRARRRSTRPGAATSTSSRCRAPSSCRWRQLCAASRAATPASRASAR